MRRPPVGWMTDLSSFVRFIVAHYLMESISTAARDQQHEGSASRPRCRNATPTAKSSPPRPVTILHSVLKFWFNRASFQGGEESANFGGKVE